MRAPDTVVTGINKIPNQLTGGEGPTSGEEVRIDVDFSTPVVLPANHYFFRPEVLLANGDFLFLSAAKPIVGGTGSFLGDLQSWTRNTDLKPDWLRVGTDIMGQEPQRIVRVKWPSCSRAYNGFSTCDGRPGSPMCRTVAVKRGIDL